MNKQEVAELVLKAYEAGKLTGMDDNRRLTDLLDSVYREEKATSTEKPSVEEKSCLPVFTKDGTFGFIALSDLDKHLALGGRVATPNETRASLAAPETGEAVGKALGELAGKIAGNLGTLAGISLGAAEKGAELAGKELGEAVAKAAIALLQKSNKQESKALGELAGTGIAGFCDGVKLSKAMAGVPAADIKQAIKGVDPEASARRQLINMTDEQLVAYYTNQAKAFEEAMAQLQKSDKQESK